MCPSLCRTVSKSNREGDLHNFSRVWTQLALELLGSSLTEIGDVGSATSATFSNIQQPKSENFIKLLNFQTRTICNLRTRRITADFQIYQALQMHLALVYACVCRGYESQIDNHQSEKLGVRLTVRSACIFLSMILWFFTGHCMNWPWTNHWSHAWRTSWYANVTGLKRDLSPRFIKIHRTHRSQVLQFCFKMFPRFQWIPMAQPLHHHWALVECIVGNCLYVPGSSWLNDFKDVDARLLDTESLVTIGSSHRRQEEQMEPPWTPPCTEFANCGLLLSSNHDWFWRKPRAKNDSLLNRSEKNI